MLRILTVLIFCFSIQLNAQDILILQNGEEVNVIVKEVGTSEIKYVKFNNQNGPLYTEAKSNVFMIKYENGTKDVFANDRNNSNSVNTPEALSRQEETSEDIESKVLGVKRGFWSLRYFKGDRRVSKNLFISDLRSDPEAYAFYTKYATTRIGERFFTSVSMVSTLIALSFTLDMQDQPALVSALAGVLSGVVSSVLGSRARSNLELAVLTYNENLRK